jgi:branched-chain amino acid transport system ATP-binding protein
MNPEETARMGTLVRRLRDEQGVTVMLIEHDMQAVMGLCETITVMNFGTLLAEGTPEQVMKVKASYTGQFLKAHLSQY